MPHHSAGYRLGGVRAKIANPLGNRGSLLHQRMSPPSNLQPPAPQLPSQVIPRRDTLGNQNITDHQPGVSIELNDNTLRRLIIRTEAPQLSVYWPSAWWKHPCYRSVYNRYNDTTILRPTADLTNPDAFLIDHTQPPAYLDPEREFSEIDRAEMALRASDWKNAVRFYSEHAALAPSDAASLRPLGIAMILDGKVSEGINTIWLAYQRNPSLAGVAINTAAFASESPVARATSEVMTLSLRAKTPDTLFVAASLKFSLGEKAVALRMLDKAKAAGVPGALESGLRTAIQQMK